MEPSRRPTARMLELRGAVRASQGGLEGGEEELLHASLERADREARLELAVDRSLVEGIERREETGGRSHPATATAGDLYRGGDVAGLAQCVAQRLHLGELVLAVV